MKAFARASAPLALILALSASLSACGNDDDEKTEDARAAREASAQACRVVAVTDASLVGPREAVRSAEFTDGLMATYDAAIVGLGNAVGGEGELPSEVTNAVVALASSYSRTRAFVQQSMLSSSSFVPKGKALTSAEERLYQALVDVCPALQDTDED